MADSSEDKRLAALERYRLLDTDEEPGFDHLTGLVAQVLGVPISLITLIDRDRQWFKSHHGLDRRETPREWAFCDHALRAADGPMMIVSDTTADPRFADNPMVTGAPFIRFYAGVPLRSSDGHALGTLCALDRTARVLTTEQIGIMLRLARVTEVELELRRRVLELDERLEQQSAATRERQRLTSMLIHDLRNPATTIALSIGLVQQHASDEIRETLSDAMAATERLHQHLIDVLDLCLAETGDLLIHPAKTSLAPLLDALQLATSYQASERGVELVIEEAPDLTWTLDRDLILRALINLVENAIEHAPPQTPVRVRLERDGNWLLLAVSDHGPRVPDGVDPFTAGDAPTGRGRGIGLAFCRLAAEVHGGEATVEPEPDAGARFSIRLPATPPS